MLKHLNLVTLLFLSLSLLLTVDATAQTEIFVRGGGKRFPIALPRLCFEAEPSGEKDPTREIPRVIDRNLTTSGLFAVINPDSYIESVEKCADPRSVSYSDWSILKVEGLVRGKIITTTQGITAQLYLHDVQKQSVVLGREYSGTLDQVPDMAHRFSNEIMRFFTGDSGPFGSKIAFSSRIGRFKEIYVMDMNGENIRQMTTENGLALYPSWNGEGTALLYTSYRNRMPDLFNLLIGSKKPVRITQDSNLEVGARYAPGGRSIILSRTEGEGSDIVLIDSNGQFQKRLSPPGGSINVSPVFSARGDEVYFCSNRAGGPQIYLMSAAGGSARRISFVNSNYCTSPAVSPRGDRIAFVCRQDGGFQIYTTNPDGSNPLQLTVGGDNEDPDWSPDGKYIAFSSSFGKKAGTPSIAIMRADGSEVQRLTQSRGGDFDPSWGPLPK